MFNNARIIATDFSGLWRVCGPGVAFRWLWAIVLNFGRIRRAGNLQTADVALGEGPFRVRLRGSSALVRGDQVVSGIREIWVRDTYLGDFLTLADGAKVVDLGANRGIFTALALGYGPNVKVVAVEADPNECERFRQNVAVNEAESRVDLINAFAGGTTKYQDGLKSSDRAATVPFVTEEQILAHLGGGPVDLVKCDIEGSEFAILANAGPLLAATQQFTAELHPDCGDVPAAIEQLKQMGFDEIESWTHPPTVFVRARRKK